MTQGILIYARNTAFDYARLAKLNLSLIHRNLKLPVAVVTDSTTAKKSDLSGFDHVIIDDTTDTNRRTFDLGHEKLSTAWTNGPRLSAYDSSPFSQTLLIDADYLIFSDQMLKLFEADPEFAVFDHVYDVTAQDRFRSLDLIGPYAIPMRWATVIYFSRNRFAESVFSMMNQIKHNYEYYSYLYRFPKQPYRNDFSLSIALHALSGQITDIKEYLIPWRCLTLSTKDRVIDYDPACGIKYLYEFIDSDSIRCGVGQIANSDLHLMDKMSVLEFYDRIVDSH